MRFYFALFSLFCFQGYGAIIYGDVVGCEGNLKNDNKLNLNQYI